MPRKLADYDSQYSDNEAIDFYAAKMAAYFAAADNADNDFVAVDADVLDRILATESVGDLDAIFAELDAIAAENDAILASA